MRTSSQGSVSAVSAKCPSVFRACNQAPRLRDSANVVAVPSLRRDEAVARSAAIAVDSYAIELDLTSTGPRFRSQTTIRFRAAPATSTFLDVRADALTAVRLNGVALDPAALHDGRFPLSLPLSPNDIGSSNDIVVDAWMAWSHDGEGLHRHVDQADGRSYAYAMSFLDAAPRWFACFDQPDLKAPVTLTVHCPADWIVAGNGPATRDGAGVWHLAQTPPIATYLATVLAGPYHSRQRTHDGVELVLHARRSLAPHLDRDADALFAHTADCLDEFHRLFGVRYPWGEYHQAFVADFNAGAMENPGCVTFDDAMIFRGAATDAQRDDRANTIAHEMAHMWFGNLVTMRWWDGIWLNESFAEFMGVHTVEQGTRFEGAWSDFCLGREAWGYRADQLPTTHPVAGEVVDNREALLNFDGISYAKGAAVLRQLVAFVGEDAFFAGLRSYLDKHAFGNTDLADLLTELERASGRDLSEWTRTWLQTSGVATLRPRWSGADLIVVQEAEVLRDHVMEIGCYDLRDGMLSLRERRSVEVTGPETVVPGLDRADVVLLNDRDLTFAKIRFDDRSRATVLADLRLIVDPLARALCWGALWDAVRDGELPARQHVVAVLRGVVAESDPSLVQTLLGQALRSATSFAPVQEQDKLVADLVRECWDVEVEVGSDLQLVRVRAAVQAMTDTRRLRDLLTGTSVPDGLVVDSELRWHVVRRAAALGEIDAAGIDRELAADRTASGQLQAEAALAALPDPDAKRRSWETALSGQATNAQVRAIGSGFWQRDQLELLHPYAERYVVDLQGLSDRVSPQLATAITTQLFPSVFITPEVLASIRGELAHERLHIGMWRALLEQQDDLSRALHAQQNG